MEKQQAIEVLREVRFESMDKANGETEISQACLIAIEAIEKMGKIQNVIDEEFY